ncbi:MAG: hypothetical protein E6K80_05360 [Candidatus Eisenbacteria bacterium]|uniref:Secreted protein n=1 Tax=Eiseniibacteriota bacterium TaxID=2212470 RepID=A0A538U6H7_UNCEI|nr:MAG: hypothetical protein E6K80_05360 [Candidatus Eisenbacteria bacterium]
MTTQAAIVLIVALIVVLMVWALAKKRRSVALREKFGPEYDRQVREMKDRDRAEAELDRRARRVEKLSIRPLPAQERDRYAEQWRHEQAHFVDDPRSAVHDADRLVEEVMRQRGYPVGEFEQRAADISVDHPALVENYRAAHDIAVRSDRGNAATEELRQAMIHFRTLFEDLLDDRMRGTPAPAPAR